MLLAILQPSGASAEVNLPPEEGGGGVQISYDCNDQEAPQPLELTAAVSLALRNEPHLIIARQNLLESRSDVMSARGAFLPNLEFLVDQERYVPKNGNAPVTVIGNNVLGGPQTNSAYGSLSFSWNLLNSGRDVAAYHGAQAGVRAADSAVGNQIEDTLMGALQAYADLYEAENALRNQSAVLAISKSIEARALERLSNGHGTSVAVGQARAAALNDQVLLYRACRTVSDKSTALAQAIGVRVPQQQRLAAPSVLPQPMLAQSEEYRLATLVEEASAVKAAKENVSVALSGLQRAKRSFGPTVSLSIRREYLGQDPTSVWQATQNVAPNDYRIGLTLEQPLFPLNKGIAEIHKGQAEVRKAEAGYDQARLEAESRLRSALSAQKEAMNSFLAARANLVESAKVLELTKSLFRAGRTDLDDVQHAETDLAKSDAQAKDAESKKIMAQWLVARVLSPADFSNLVLRQLHVAIDAEIDATP